MSKATSLTQPQFPGKQDHAYIRGELLDFTFYLLVCNYKELKHLLEAENSI